MVKVVNNVQTQLKAEGPGSNPRSGLRYRSLGSKSSTDEFYLILYSTDSYIKRILRESTKAVTPVPVHSGSQPGKRNPIDKVLKTNLDISPES